MLILVYIGLLHRQLCQWSQNQPYQESDIPPLDANELYDTLQGRGGGGTRVYRNDKSETGCSNELEECL